MKIAVFVDEYGNVLPFIASGVVEMYSDDSGEWNCINQIPFDLNQTLSIGDLRKRTRMLVSEFEDCELLVIKSIKGLAKVLLEEFKIGTWQFNGVFPIPLFDKIKIELQRAREKHAKQTVAPVLVGESADAIYEINLTSILEQNSSLNSRDLLVPFMQNTSFRKLTIKCSHSPKWLEQVVTLLQLKYGLTEMDDGQIHIVVEPIDFEADITTRKQFSLNDITGAGNCSSGCCSSGIC